MLAPVIVFIYNRPVHTQQTLEALAACELANKSEIIIFSDAPKNAAHAAGVVATRKMVQEKNWGFASLQLIERDENYGLARSIIEGVTQVMEEYGKAIIVEDDLLVNPSFLTYMNQALDKYEAREKVFSVGGFSFPPDLMPIPESYTQDVYFSHRSTPWGWASWLDRWLTVDWEVKDIDSFRKSVSQMKQFNIGGDDMTDMLFGTMNGKLNSWWIRFAYAHFKQKKLTVTPVQSLVQNIGLDGSGVHCEADERFDEAKIRLDKWEFTLPDEVVADPAMVKAVYKAMEYPLRGKVKRWVQRIVGVYW